MLIFPFADHVRNICKTCFIQMRDLTRVLTDDATVLAANALVSSRLDYCNSLFRNLSTFNMHKLQCTQNTLRRIVRNCNRYSGASHILKKLHWLPVEFRCIFKTATLVYKFLHSGHTTSALICLFVAEGMAQDTTAQIRGSWRFLNFTHLYTNRKNTLVTVLLLMLPHSGTRLGQLGANISPDRSSLTPQVLIGNFLKHNYPLLYELQHINLLCLYLPKEDGVSPDAEYITQIIFSIFLQ